MMPSSRDVEGLICVTLLGLCVAYTHGAAGTTVGKLFAVATMKLIGNSWPIGSVEFFLYTANPALVLVNVSIGSVFTQNTSVSPFGQRHLTANASLTKSTTDMAFTPAYVFRGSGFFGLCVLMLDSMPLDSYETYLAIPVESWGRSYFLVSLESRMSALLVAANNEVKLTVHLRFENSSASLAYNGSKIATNSKFTILLKSWHAFSLSACHDSQLASSFTVLQVLQLAAILNLESFPEAVGWELGTYFVVTSPSMARQAERAKRSMLMPREQYGREFVLFFTRDRPSRGYILLVAGADDVTVTHSRAHGDLEVLHLKHEGGFLQVSLKGGPSMLRSNKGVLVMHVMRSACPGEVGGPSLCMIVPVELFHHTYIWSTPVSPRMSTVRHYIYVVVSEVSIPQLNFDGEFLLADSITWNYVNGYSDWRAGNTAVKAGSHRLLHEYKSRFGLYLYGLERSRAYMHPAGFIAAFVNVVCSRSPTVVDDLLDNDCDNNIDEEIQDFLDNDGDGMVDEDIRNTTEKERLGNNKAKEDYIKDEWSIWTEWQCQTCTDTRLFRTRNCHQSSNQRNVRSCHGNRVEAKDGNCYVAAKCPEDCPLHYWSMNCSRTCFNCQGDCRKYSGICDRCKQGYKFPNNGCQTECGANEYGENCEGNCYDKCNHDCYNRENGDCFDKPSRTGSVILLTMPIIIATIVLGIWACSKQDRPNPHGESKDPLEISQLSTSSLKELLSNWKVLEMPTPEAPRVEVPSMELVDGRPVNTLSTPDTQVSLDSDV